ncbi:hypothetical protein ACQ4PT_066917 [Festuca glaucescens]
MVMKLGFDNFSRSPTSRTIGDTLLRLSAPEADTEYPFVDKLRVEDRAQLAEIRSLDLTRKEKIITSVFSRRRKGKPGPDNKMHNTNKEQHGGTDDVAVARPVENTKECATSLAVAVNKKGSQVHKSLSTNNRDKPPSSSAIAGPQKRGRKKKASKKDKHSTDSAIVPTKGKGDEGSNDGDNPTSSSQVVLYASHVEECAVDTVPAETNQLKKIPELIKSVRDAGFGHFIDTKIKGSINCKGMSFILKHIDIPTMTVRFTEEKKIEINRYSIHHLYGIPNGHLSAPRLNENNEVLPELKQELGFRSNEDITARKLVDMLIVMVNEHLGSNAAINRDLALKLFYLILFNKGLCIGTAPHISSKEANMVKGLDYDKIRDMDFCQLVVDELQSSAIKWQGHEDAETSNVIAEADAPDLETSAATISETSADMLAESLDPSDCKTSTGSDDAGCDVSVVATTVGEPSTAVGPEDEQKLEDGQHMVNDEIGKYPSIQTTQTWPSELMFEESGDAKPKEMPVIMEDPCAISDLNANDALIKDVSDEGTEEENELAPTGDNEAGEQEETNVVSLHHEQEQQINKETSGVQSESKENSNIAIEEEAIVDLRCNRIQRNNDGNVNMRKFGNLIKAINPVDDSLLLDRYEMIKIPCFEEEDKDNPVGHYFVMAVNLRRKRFELLDSLGGEGAEQHFVNTAEVFKEIWKEAYKQSEGRLSHENLDDFTYEKPKVIPLQGATLNCGVYMIMFLMFWTGKSLFHIRQDDILYIRKRLLYLIIIWEQLEVNIGLIKSLHKDDFIEINSGEYNIIRKQTTVKPTMTVIVSLPNVNIPNPKEIDDGKENYPQEQEYVLISSQEDYNMECLKGRGRGEDDSKKELDGNCQPEETAKNDEEHKNQQQQKPMVARNNEDNNIEYLRAREAKVDDPSRNSKEKGPLMIQTNAGPKRLNVVLFTPPNRKSSPPGYKVEKDMYSGLTGSQGFQTPPKDSKSNSVDVQHADNLNRGKRKLVSSSDVTSTKRPKLTARKLCEPVAEYRPKRTEVFNAPVMHSAIPDMKVPITGAEIKRQFGNGEFLDGGTMDYIIDEMRTTSELYDTGERVLLSQGFIMVSILNKSIEQIKEASAKKGKTFNYTEDFNMQIALDAFPRYVEEGKSLLDAKLILMTYFKSSHYTLYVMNKYKTQFEIFDSRNYAVNKGDVQHYTRSTFHTECDIIMTRMELVVKEVYGLDAYNASNQPNRWVACARKPRYIKCPYQGLNQCAFYCLMCAYQYDGDVLLGNKEGYEPILKDHPSININRAEYLYTLIFTMRNTAKLPDEILALQLSCPFYE